MLGVMGGVVGGGGGKCGPVKVLEVRELARLWGGYQ